MIKMIHIARLVLGLIILYLGGCSLVTLHMFFQEEDVYSLPKFVRIPGTIIIIIFVAIIVLFVSYTIGYSIVK